LDFRIACLEALRDIIEGAQKQFAHLSADLLKSLKPNFSDKQPEIRTLTCELLVPMVTYTNTISMLEGKDGSLYLCLKVKKKKKMKEMKEMKRNEKKSFLFCFSRV